MAITREAMLRRVLERQDDEHADLQALIDKGMWGLEGSIGRAMFAAIEAGVCILGEEGVRDYWGNYIPSRTEVKEGTKGSVTYAYRQSLTREDYS